MKKWMKIALIVLCAVLVFEVLAWVIGIRVNPLAVEKIELYSYDYENDEEYHVELTEEEKWMVSLLYNMSTIMRKLYADPPPMSDRLVIYSDSGEMFSVAPLDNEKLLTKQSYHKISNPLLYKYIQLLLEKHGLPAW